MPYSERQLQCLSAMGLVAWRQRAPLASDASPRAESVGAAGAPAGAGAVAEAVARTAVASTAVASTTAVIPREPALLGAWLTTQPLAPFSYKGRSLTRVGRADAPLFVVVERAPGVPPNELPDGSADDTLPLAGAAAELFERMLASLGLARRDTCQCVLSPVPQPGGDTVGPVAGTARRAVLVLVQALDAALDADGCRIATDIPGAPAWCLPHPDVLLAAPLRKRQAWLVLKALRRHLGGVP